MQKSLRGTSGLDGVKPQFYTLYVLNLIFIYILLDYISYNKKVCANTLSKISPKDWE